MPLGPVDNGSKHRAPSTTRENASLTPAESTSYSDGTSTSSSSSKGSRTYVHIQSSMESRPAPEVKPLDGARERTPMGARVHPVYTAPKPALRFVNITDPKQTKTDRFKTDVRSQAMTSHMWNKGTRPQGITKKDSVPAPGSSLAALKKRILEDAKALRESNDDIEEVESYGSILLRRAPEMDGYKNDPFGLFPTIEGDIHVNVPQLVHHGIRMYSTDHIDILSFWTHSIDPLTIIPSMLVISEHIDLLNGLSRDSRRTVALRSKSLSLLNDHLQNPASIDDDLTIMTITKMLSSEQITYGDGVKVHQSALQGVVNGRGGLLVMQQKTPFMGPYVTSVVLYHCVIHEIQPAPHWTNFPPHQYRFATTIAHQGAKHADLHGDSSSASVYSPHMKRGPKMGFIGQLVEPFADPSELVEFLPIRQSKYFSKHAHDLLITLRNTINIFLDLSDDARQSDALHRKPSTMEDIQSDLKAVLLHTQLLPSAADLSSQNPVAGDWLYECCRLTCLVAFTFMYLRIPFSQSNHLLAERYSSVLPTTAFGAALLRTDLTNLWSDMSAILTFLVIIMAAAAAKITPASKEHDYRARKWIIMTYMRSCITLGFEPGWAFNGLLRLLVDVQAQLTEGQDEL
ncbi:hypothetical protein EJ05DRAFT_177861 [Pseudovirgaria hyperparasitica]|uniref:Transcription factor domain-containing protein n=1 Tax=Pseudovirgaria hyperparasitica TaxID=470096 RepID=A0A6A6WIS1_9PEZI|nr:uncharacterized protein EJ05DRAFT_177861 [Pseudovirgaria hyperparasitica]KAF2761587.1 hypothetical protein EJ05DRAFT_177861 [Pseudovirgaria hyperparasitica]